MRKHKSVERPSPVLGLIVLAIGFVAGLAVCIGLVVKIQPAAASEHAVVPPELQDPRVLEVAAHFMCPCSMCGQMELADCTCGAQNGGIESKQRILALLNQGLSQDDVVRRLAPLFGTLTPEKPAAASSAAGPGTTAEESHTVVTTHAGLGTAAGRAK